MNLEDTRRLRFERLDGELKATCGRRKQAKIPVSVLNESLWGVIGHCDNPQLSCKAAVSGEILRFSVEMVEKHVNSLPDGEPLLEAGRALREYLRITRAGGPCLSVAESAVSPL